ncbi:hypothetical protein AOXY_G9608 [Acipenser oxyrinchus oxyrinchus]|uniref:Uncharacterized protein n=1 Tax=Acipenser oxyrinchus oxyrinchus TaxID=40147 RepID=A0AAD8G4R9_ACIOX|nr:hypothetical protein AOXY_G9608 [Acipenser oxyrinchus oxyrinchus]
MARHDTQGFSCKRNSKLDSFLKRNLEQRVYERVRACEACVVISETIKKVFMYVVLSDHCIYLTENPPKTIQAAVHFRNISGIELVNDIPDFLSGRDRESAQHIRILYTSTARKKLGRYGQGGGTLLLPARTARSSSRQLHVNGSRLFSARSSPAKSAKISRRATNSALRGTAETEDFRVKQSRSSSDLKGLSLCDSRDPPARPRPLPRPPSTASLSSCLSTLALSSPPGPASGRALHARSSSVLTDWGQQAEASEPRAAGELHLYVVYKSSLIFLHLKNSWNNYIIQSTLMQDPQYSKKFRVQSTSPGQGQGTCSSEQTVKLFSQLTCELFQEDSTLEETYALVQELKTAAQRNFMLKRLFWKSNDLFPFLIKKLSDYLPKSHNVPGQLDWGHQADTFVVCIMIVQTLALMFRETDTEPARTSILRAKRGAVTRTLLMALVREPLIHKAASRPGTVRVAHSVPMDRGTDTEVQKLITEYSEAATAVLYEIILLAHQGNLTSDWGRFMTVGWVMAVLQGLPSMVSFIGSVVKAVISVLSPALSPALPPALPLLSPSQAVLLYQQLYILSSCIQYSSSLAEDIRTEYSEEFRYYIQTPSLEERFPLCYPITLPTVRLLAHVLELVEHKPAPQL